MDPASVMSLRCRIRLVSRWEAAYHFGAAEIATGLACDEADALLCDWAPADELFSFPRRKAWYCCEPWCQFRGLGGGTWPAIRGRLQPHEFLWHGHPDPRFRVPHVTHFEPLTMHEAGDRLPRAIAIVSNHGGHPLRRHPHVTYRNRFITHPVVDLHGRSGWQRYQPHWWSKRRAPSNYRGEIPGDWPAGEKRTLMARYKVAVCLENMNEPHYFTEKFVEAVCAGCVPVYRAHPTVAASVLRGAAWIDPADHGDDPERTLAAALAADADAFRARNAQWLRSPALAATHHEAVFRRLAAILTPTAE